MTKRKPCGLRDEEKDCATCGAVRPHNEYETGAMARLFTTYYEARLPPVDEDDEYILESDEVVDLADDECYLGWRLWAAVEGPDGLTLVAPYRPDPTYPPAVWQPGLNVASTENCWAADCTRHKHPSPNCWCGFRACSSREVLAAFAEDQGDRWPDLIAVAEVELSGRVTGPARGDDWGRTLRASHAGIRGTLWLMGPGADEAKCDSLASRYGLDVQLVPG